MIKLLSIVVPIYNVEEYVERCIYSLLNQDLSYEDYEIICVNDGSPDGSRDRVINLQKEYRNIILIDQENQGVSVARNKGAERATGKYILFVDPDDYLVENSLSTIVGEAVRNEAEMTIPGYLFHSSDGIELGRKIFDIGKKKLLSGIDAYYYAREKGHIVTDTSVGVVFEIEFLHKNGLFYKQGIILNQDVELLARIHCLAEKCLYLNKFMYVAVTRQGSASRSDLFLKEQVRDGFIIAAENLKKFQNLNNLNSEKKTFLNGPITKFVLLAIYSAFKSRSFRKLNDTIEKLRLSGLSKLNLEGCSNYNRICGSAYNISPFLSSIVIPIYLKVSLIKRKYTLDLN